MTRYDPPTHNPPLPWLGYVPLATEKKQMKNDPISPNHYGTAKNPHAVIELTETLTFNRGNVVKYVARAGRKGEQVEDLKKALWYLTRELSCLEDSQ